MNSHFNRSDQRINAPPPPMCCYILSLLSQSARNTGSKTKATISHCENLQACLLRRSQVANITILIFCPQLSSNSHQAVFMLMTLLSIMRLLKRNVHHFFARSVLFVSHHPSILKRSCSQTASAAALVHYYVVALHHQVACANIF